MIVILSAASLVEGLVSGKARLRDVPSAGSQVSIVSKVGSLVDVSLGLLVVLEASIGDLSSVGRYGL